MESTEYLKVISTPDYIDILFIVESKKIMKIGEEMQKRCEEAYMNGYNWEAFFNAYMKINCPEILEKLKTDAEAGSYSIIFEDVNEQTRSMSKQLFDRIKSLVENEQLIYDFMENHNTEIEWD
uniref:Immunity protein 51 n=1 Tax=Caecomyces sp. TaxID=2078661 RepID=A0A2S1TZE8_9FUNG|nr:Immunity protein 51 [Caecomyces sp.]